MGHQNGHTECPHGVHPYALCEYCLDMVQMCEAYLADLGCVLFGQAFDIVDPKQRAEAAVWLTDQIHGVLPGWFLAQLVPEAAPPASMGSQDARSNENDSTASQDKNV